MVAKFLSTLDAIGQAENTAIIFTSDHGEMLGERGMWFKKHFFESALRIPLIMRLPGGTPTRVQTPVSLVDLLPTFMGVAKGTGWESEVEMLEGRDLGAIQTSATEPERPIYAEYLAEATPSPMLMIRKGRYKFIWSDHDPILLFDLANDPNELINIASDASRRGTVEMFEALVREKWNAAMLTDRIVQSQKRRRLILDGYVYGQKPRWNHDESEDDKVIWYRGDQGYNDWAFAFLPKRLDTP